MDEAKKNVGINLSRRLKLTTKTNRIINNFYANNKLNECNCHGNCSTIQIYKKINVKNTFIKIFHIFREN